MSILSYPFFNLILNLRIALDYYSFHVLDTRIESLIFFLVSKIFCVQNSIAFSENFISSFSERKLLPDIAHIKEFLIMSLKEFWLIVKRSQCSKNRKGPKYKFFKHKNSCCHCNITNKESIAP